ncbi:MAG: hypothetical protein Q7K42_02285 [Candidatus Diapherotrites archaeon]|nr:hypothetical protein [Candidatus Diapherotrites archaeon]
MSGREIISNYENFVKAFAGFGDISQDHPRIKALKQYFKTGGVISAISSTGKWPKIIYPSPFKLTHQINETRKILDNFLGKKDEWTKKYASAKLYNLKIHALKFFDPLYWQHVSKMVLDKDYSNDAGAIKLPAQMVVEPKYRPMIEMFVKDLDYRKQLTETVQTSIFYKNDKRVAKYAGELREFRITTSNRNLEIIQKKVDDLTNQINTLETILGWVREK